MNKVLKKVSTTTVNINEIQLNQDNPRLIREDSFNKLVNSIKQFPQMLDIRPIVVNKDMIILGGNMRYKACVEAGMTEIPVVIADNLTKEQEKEFLVKDNVSGGEWDWDILANEWDNQELIDWGVDVWLPDEDISNNTDYSMQTVDEKLDRFLDAKIKNITIPFESEEFDDVVNKLEALMDKYDCADYRELVYKIIENEKV